MINREITYERNMSNSYLKIPACREETFDEQILLKKEIKGCLKIEKSYLNGAGQYWYSITGKQALDQYSKIKPLKKEFIEKLVLAIEAGLAEMDWNLLEDRCLVLDPEYIFIENGTEEIFFVLYPENKGEVYEEYRKLMEFLLTRLDHSDGSGVKLLYGIYEITLTEGYSLKQIRQMLGQEKKIPPRDKPEAVAITKREIREEEPKKIETKPQRPDGPLQLQGLWEQVKAAVMEKIKQNWPKKETKRPEVAHLEPEQKVQIQMDVSTKSNPTVNLFSTEGEARGVLLYQGRHGYPDVEFYQKSCSIGSRGKADLHIPRDTVSAYHANIEYIDKSYYLEDLNSKNGTFVQEVPVNYKQKTLLKPGDEIRFADVRYRFL